MGRSTTALVALSVLLHVVAGAVWYASPPSLSAVISSATSTYSSGDTIFLTDGIFTTCTAGALPDKTLTFVGMANTKIACSSPASNNVRPFNIPTSYTSTLTLKNLTFEAYTPGSPTASAGMFDTSSATTNYTLVFDNVVFQNTLRISVGVAGQYIRKKQAGAAGAGFTTIVITRSLFRDARIDTSGTTMFGGAIALGLTTGGTSLSISDSEFRNNTMGGNGSGKLHGIGIYMETPGSPLVVSNTRFIGHTAASSDPATCGDGGGVFVVSTYGTVTLTNATFSGNNMSTYDSFGAGVKIVTGGAITLTNVTAVGNQVTGEGGGVFIDLSSNYMKVTISNSTFNSNTARYGGGGLTMRVNSCNGAIASTHTILIKDTTFMGNRAGLYGGGLHIDTEFDTGLYNTTYGLGMTFRRNQFINNGVTFDDQELLKSTYSYYGTTFSYYGSLTSESSTIGLDQIAPWGSGGALFMENGRLNMTDCVFNDNFAYYWGSGIYLGGDGRRETSNTWKRVTFVGNYMIRPATTTYTTIGYYESYYYLPPLNNYGGAAHLSFQSLNVDGLTCLFNVAGCGGCLYLGYANLTINNAIIQSNTAEVAFGGAIMFMGAGQGYMQVSNTDFSYNEAWGFGGGAVRVEAPVLDKTWTNVNFTYNRAATMWGTFLSSPGDPVVALGGAVLLSTYITWNKEITNAGRGAISYTNCHFNRNEANGGGAITMDIAWHGFHYGYRVENCEFNDNYAQTAHAGQNHGGGAIMFSTPHDSISFYGVTVIGSTFRRNRAGTRLPVALKEGPASRSNGGAIGLQNRNYADVINCTFIDNYASRSGGAIWGEGGTSGLVLLTVTGSTFVNNTADAAGSAIDMYGVNATITNNTFTNNLLVPRDPYDVLAGGVVSASARTMVILTDNGFYNNSVIKTTNVVVRGGCLGALGDYYWGLADVKVKRNTFINCSSDFDGGAIAVGLSAVVSLDNCVLQNNRALGKGGAIHLSGSSASITVDNITIRNNTASRGGGIYIAGDFGSSVVLSHIDFVQNVATSYGGGIFTEYGAPDLILSDLSFTSNVGGTGGAITLYNAGILSDITFTNNIATLSHGGAIAVLDGGDLTLSDCDFTGSQAAKGDGGAIYVSDSTGLYSIMNADTITMINGVSKYGGALAIDGTCDVTVAGVTMQGNSAQFGGAIFAAFDASFDLSNAVMTDHNALYGGGAYLLSTDNVHMTNVTMTNSFAESGGGVYMSQAALKMDHSTLTNSRAERHVTSSGLGGGFFAYSSDLQLDHVTVDKAWAVRGGSFYATLLSSLEVTDSTLKNGVAQSSGGGGVLTQSSMAMARTTVDNNTAPDAGGLYVTSSAEAALTGCTLTRNTAGNNGGAILFDGASLSVNASTLNNNAADKNGGAVRVSSDGMVALTGCSMHGNQAGIQGGTLSLEVASQVLVSGGDIADSSAQSGGALFITATLNVTLSNLAIARSSASGSAGIAPSGGAIYCSGTLEDQLTLSHVNINSAQSTGVRASRGVGGGVASYGCTMAVTGGSITGCTSGAGGAIFAAEDLGRGTAVTTTIRGATISHNRATNTDGGAINAIYSASLIQGSTISDNTAARDGGSVYYDAPSADPASLATPGFTGNQVSNSKARSGGGVFVKYAQFAPTTYTIMTDNTLSNNSNTAPGYGDNLATPPQQLIWKVSPQAELHSGDNLGQAEVGAVAAFSVEVRDVFGSVTTITDVGVFVNVAVGDPATAALLGVLLAPVLNGVATFQGLQFISGTFGAHNITVSINSLPAVAPITFGFQAIACEDGTSLLQTGLDFPVCQAPPCPAGSFGFPGACLPCPPGTANEFAGQTSCPPCPASAYSAAGALTCSDCPPWGSCDAGAVTRKAGWWGTPSGDVYSCENPLACPGGGLDLTTCAEGYTGYLCGRCDTGYGRQFSSCLKCWSVGASVVLVIFYIVVIVLGMGFLIKTAPKESDPTTVIAKILLSYLQMLQIVVAFTCFAETPVPNITVFAQASTPSATVLPVSCIIGYSFFNLLYFMLALPIVVTAILALFWWIWALTSPAVQRVRARAYDRFISSVVVLMFVVYPSLTSTILKTFECRSKEEGGRLRADLEVECYSPQHLRVVAVAIIGALVYGVGVPVATYLVMRRNEPRLHEPRVRTRYIFLFSGFKNKNHSWGVVVLVRKAFLVGLQVFGASYPGAQVAIGTVMLFAMAAMQLKSNPFEVENLNHAEAAGLAALFIVLAGGVAITGGYSAKDFGVYVVLISLAGVCAIVALGMLSLLTQMVWARRRRGNVVAITYDAEESTVVSSGPAGMVQMVELGSTSSSATGAGRLVFDPENPGVFIEASLAQMKSTLEKATTNQNQGKRLRHRCAIVSDVCRELQEAGMMSDDLGREMAAILNEANDLVALAAPQHLRPPSSGSGLNSRMQHVIESIGAPSPAGSSRSMSGVSDSPLLGSSTFPGAGAGASPRKVAVSRSALMNGTSTSLTDVALVSTRTNSGPIGPDQFSQAVTRLNQRLLALLHDASDVDPPPPSHSLANIANWPQEDAEDFMNDSNMGSLETIMYESVGN